MFLASFMTLMERPWRLFTYGAVSRHVEAYYLTYYRYSIGDHYQNLVMGGNGL